MADPHYRAAKPVPDKHRIYTSASLQKVRSLLMLDPHPAAREAEGVINAYEGLLEKLGVADVKGPVVKEGVANADTLMPLRERWKLFTEKERAVTRAEIMRVHAIYKNGRFSEQRSTAQVWLFIQDLVKVVAGE